MGLALHRLSMIDRVFKTQWISRPTEPSNEEEKSTQLTQARDAERDIHKAVRQTASRALCPGDLGAGLDDMWLPWVSRCFITAVFP
ncbi:hypothetical protein BBP40_004334 [Aspergillus hancockii]|nr:hypothetical protein BBP40_004334 [Aspergillus hancockii]